MRDVSWRIEQKDGEAIDYANMSLLPGVAKTSTRNVGHEEIERFQYAADLTMKLQTKTASGKLLRY